VADNAFVQGLNGEEIISDLCDQLADRLRLDCNLRGIDSYSLGYSAKITVNLKCYGMDEAVVEAELEVGEENDNPEQLQKDFTEEIEIPQEVDLSLVRERSQQEAPSFEISPDGPIQPQKRKYSRRLKALGLDGGEAQASGGATGPLDE
jgi:hypothetical protein